MPFKPALSNPHDQDQAWARGGALPASGLIIFSRLSPAFSPRAFACPGTTVTFMVEEDPCPNDIPELTEEDNIQVGDLVGDPEGCAQVGVALEETAKMSAQAGGLSGASRVFGVNVLCWEAQLISPLAVHTQVEFVRSDVAAMSAENLLRGRVDTADTVILGVPSGLSYPDNDSLVLSGLFQIQKIAAEAKHEVRTREQ